MPVTLDDTQYDSEEEEYNEAIGAILNEDCESSISDVKRNIVDDKTVSGMILVQVQYGDDKSDMEWTPLTPDLLALHCPVTSELRRKLLHRSKGDVKIEFDERVCIVDFKAEPNAAKDGLYRAQYYNSRGVPCWVPVDERMLGFRQPSMNELRSRLVDSVTNPDINLSKSLDIQNDILHYEVKEKNKVASTKKRSTTSSDSKGKSNKKTK